MAEPRVLDAAYWLGVIIGDALYVAIYGVLAYAVSKAFGVPLWQEFAVLWVAVEVRDSWRKARAEKV